MTFDDDFCRLNFLSGPRDHTCKQLGITWPPADFIHISVFTFKRINYSKITDEQREGMTHVARGAEYEVVRYQEDEHQEETDSTRH